jgi:NADH:ubiquinone oxidoreductase subunit 3 (subunit A)
MTTEEPEGKSSFFLESAEILKSGSKLELNKKEKTVSSIIIIIEIIFAIFFAWFIIYRGTGWNGLILVYIFFPILDIFSVWGIFKGIILLKGKKIHFISVLLLLMSLCSFAPPYFIGYALKPITTSITNKNYLKTLSPEQKQQRQGNIDKANLQYNALAEKFKSPQIVSVVDDEYAVLILENGDIILPINPFTREGEKEDFISWAKENLINQEVQIKIPSHYFGITNCTDPSASNPGNQTTQKIRQKYNLSPDKGGICSIIGAKVSYNGQFLDEKFK